MAYNEFSIENAQHKYTMRNIVTDWKFSVGVVLFCVVLVAVLYFVITNNHSSENPKLECTSHNQCSENMACTDNKCVDPCQGACGVNATCRILRHVTSCACPEGYTGDAFVACRPIQTESQAECTSHSMCPWQNACVKNMCIDPCIGSCATNATCKAVNHEATCSCPKHYTGDGYVECKPTKRATFSNKGLGPPPIGTTKRYQYEQDVKLDWYDAFSYCLNKGGRLASVNSEEENEMINREIEDSVDRYGIPYEDLTFWTSGALFNNDEGKFVWMSTNQPFTFTNWGTGEPNKHQGEPEECMDIRKRGELWIWNDVSCDYKFHLICEYYEGKQIFPR